MSRIVSVECRSCGARVSGVRTELGSLIVPGREGCPRCGSADFSEVPGGGGAGVEAGSAGEVGADPENGTRSKD